VITLTVTAYNGAATAAISGQFDETGGNIGRAENNQLVLPDPERTISRVHAQVVYRNGRYAIVDRGSNPIAVNGRPLGNGKETLLQPGDEILIGGYSLRVEAGGSAAGAPAADPFADFAGLAAAAPRQSLAAAPPQASGAAFGDPLAAFGSAPRAGSPSPASSVASPAAAASGIPLDWDPFAPDVPSSSTAPDLARSLGQAPGDANFGLDVGGRAQPLIPEFGGAGAGGGDSLDALFGLSAAQGRDPLAGSALNQAAAQPNMSANADPLKSLNSMTRASASAAPDLLPELNTPFQLPPMAVPGAAALPATRRPGAAAEALPAPAAARAPAASEPPLARPPAAAMPRDTIPETTFGLPPPSARPAPAVRTADIEAPADAVLSWSDPSGESRTFIRPRNGDNGQLRTPAATPTPDVVDLSLDFAAPAPAAAAAPGAAVPAPAAAPLQRPPGGQPPAVQPPAMQGAMQPAAQAHAAQPLPRAAVAAPPHLPPQFAPGAVAAPAPSMQAPAAASHPAAAAPRSPAPAHAAAASAGSDAGSADIAALTAALREGLGVHGLPPEALVLTPTLMRLMGRLVHEATRGTVDLLMARAALKREIRAEVTMIVSRENNPLKFSPSTEVALGHLLSPPARGFMEADKAMRDAYDDLRAHQFAFLAGMRAALEGVLKRFDPAQLEGKLTQKSMLASLIPAKRKAGMWDVFTQLYAQISSEASDDFHELFGKEFLRAYNEHIDQLARDRP
jgi:FHA domain-containing protein